MFTDRWNNNCIDYDWSTDPLSYVRSSGSRFIDGMVQSVVD